MKTRLSSHFYRKEFACKCGCGGDTVDVELLRVLDQLRMRWMAPVIITSGYRCAAHNAKVGGAPDSQHLVGKAADIAVRGISAETIADYLDDQYPGRYGIGRYPTWTHIDVREREARW